VCQSVIPNIEWSSMKYASINASWIPIKFESYSQPLIEKKTEVVQVGRKNLCKVNTHLMWTALAITH
jgi:hypothetical protein